MEIESDYVFYENLVDFTITNIETLLIEGLKIQCNMLIRKHLQALVKYAGKLASLGKTLQLGGDFLDVDELMEYCVSLEEWLSQGVGDFDIGDKINEFMKILAIHQAESIEWCSGQLG